MSLVSFVKINQPSDYALKRYILDSLNLIGYYFQSNVTAVAIKPNLCYYWDYSTGHTTDPKFVVALIDILREQISPNVEISIVESDASAMKCRYAFKMLGYEKMAKEKNVKLVNLSEDESEEVNVTANGQNFSFHLPQTIRDADLRINVPKIKYMTQTKISCALKNIFGCNPTPTKYKLHPHLNEAIVALNKTMKFNLHILDGIIIPGPPPYKLNLLMASQDPVAFDSAAAKIANVNPRAVKHLVLANREGLGNINYTAKGEPLKTFARQYPKKKTSTKILLFAYTLATKTGLVKTELL